MNTKLLDRFFGALILATHGWFVLRYYLFPRTDLATLYQGSALLGYYLVLIVFFVSGFLSGVSLILGSRLSRWVVTLYAASMVLCFLWPIAPNHPVFLQQMEAWQKEMVEQPDKIVKAEISYFNQYICILGCVPSLIYSWMRQRFSSILNTRAV